MIYIPLNHAFGLSAPINFIPAFWNSLILSFLIFNLSSILENIVIALFVWIKSFFISPSLYAIKPPPNSLFFPIGNHLVGPKEATTISEYFPNFGNPIHWEQSSIILNFPFRGFIFTWIPNIWGIITVSTLLGILVISICKSRPQSTIIGLQFTLIVASYTLLQV